MHDWHAKLTRALSFSLSLFLLQRNLCIVFKHHLTLCRMFVVHPLTPTDAYLLHYYYYYYQITNTEFQIAVAVSTLYSIYPIMGMGMLNLRGSSAAEHVSMLISLEFRWLEEFVNEATGKEQIFR